VVCTQIKFIILKGKKQMWRYHYTIVRNVFRLLDAIKTMKDMIELSKNRPDEYNEEAKYRYVQYIVDVMQKTGHIKTEVFGRKIYLKMEDI